MLLALDISTSCTGYAIYSEYGDLLTADYVDLNKAIKGKITFADGRQEFDELRLKAQAIIDVIVQKITVADYDLQNVVIESPLMASNNAKTVVLLARFNAMVSTMLYDEFTICPYYITVSDWRKYAFPNVHRHKGDNVKELYAQEVLKLYPDLKLDLNKKGKVDKKNFDMLDAIAIGRGWLMKNGKSGKNSA